MYYVEVDSFLKNGYLEIGKIYINQQLSISVSLELGKESHLTLSRNTWRIKKQPIRDALALGIGYTINGLTIGISLDVELKGKYNNERHGSRI